MSETKKVTFEEFCEHHALTSKERQELQDDLKLWAVCVDFKGNPLTQPLLVVQALGLQLLQRREEWVSMEPVV